jgi:catechol 2,3-dioxygenase-like lactoylglutathione lyase family enzyme
MASVNVRYIVNDAEVAVAFYTKHLDFRVEIKPATGFAMLSRGDLRLLLSAPGAGGRASGPMSDGRHPHPGGWNRIQLQVDDLEHLIGVLRKAGARFRNDTVVGRGGKHILLDDPSGNCIELFEPDQ